MTLVYPRPEDLKFQNANDLIEENAIFNKESRDYLKIQIIDSKNSSYSNYVGRNSNSTGASIGTATNPPKDTLSLIETIFLYVPQQLSETFQASYNEASIGMLGAGALNAMNQRGNTASMAQEVKEAANGLKPEVALSTMASAITAVAQVAGVGGSGVDANTISQLNKGAILNPYKELIYQGTAFRSHSFSFKLIARSMDDAATIQNIVYQLKKAMHPGVAGIGADEQFGPNADGTQNQQQTTQGTATGKFSMGDSITSERWLLLPDFFKLELVRVQSDIAKAEPLKKVITFPVFCVLSGMTVNYTPDGQYNPIKLGEDTTQDRGVIAIDLSLTFQETAMLTKVNFGGSKQAQLVSQQAADAFAKLAAQQNGK